MWLALLAAWLLVGLLPQVLPDLPRDWSRLIQSMLAGSVGVTAVIVACRVLDRRRLESLGFRWTRADLAALVAGAGLWVGLAAVGVLVGATTGAFSVTFGPPTWAMIGWLLFQMILVFSYEALPEELALRGYIYTNLVERLPRWLAVVAQAVLFMLWAFALVGLTGLADWSVNLDRAVLLLSFGITLALIRLWTGSLWGSIGFHWAFQTVMQLLGFDRLTVVRIPAQDLESAGVMLWFFSIVVGGVIAWVGLVRTQRRGPDPGVRQHL